MVGAMHERSGSTTKADRVRALRASAGSWNGRSFTGAEYVEATRGDRGERLGQHGPGRMDKDDVVTSLDADEFEEARNDPRVRAFLSEAVLTSPISNGRGATASQLNTGSPQRKTATILFNGTARAR